ncbi:LysR family transcriptional regulator [Zhongshania guokunii]|uniref:LysR family transcriptional regulator n=1 Tax=Zhongshania guokunii TaxID=641783 RepID=A0ABV3UAP8_9GAMM
MGIKKTNLNQLRVLSVLLREPNLSRASEVLGLSQPTLSSALKQMRDEFNDPLLVRVGNKMELTNRARSLLEPLDIIFNAVDLLWENEESRPDEMSRRIIIGTTDYGTAIASSALQNILSAEAPGITLQFVDVAETRRLINRENEMDFYLVPDAICHSPAFLEFKYLPLYTEEMVYMVNRDHRLVGLESITEEDYRREKFTLYHLGEERTSLLTRKVLAEMESEHDIVMRIQQFSLLPMIAEETDTVVIVPRRLAEKLVDRFNCKILGPSAPAVPFTFNLMWESVHQSDRVHEYMRSVFRRLFDRREEH